MGGPLAEPPKPRRKLPVLVQQTFFHPYRRDIFQNMNFFEYIEGRSYKVYIPIKFVGIDDCKGCLAGGIFLFGQDYIACWWDSANGPLPREVEFDISDVPIATSVYLSDLPALPKQLRLRPSVNGADPIVCHIKTQGGEVSSTWKLGEDDADSKKTAYLDKLAKLEAENAAEQWENW